MKNNNSLRWTLSRIMQFEGYRLQDQARPEDELEARDRAIYQNAPSKLTVRSDAYVYWLNQRLQQSPPQPDAGKLFSGAYGWAVLMVIILGLLGGASITYGALYYDGSVPVNVALFLGVVVLPQLLLLGLLLLTLLVSIVGSNAFAGWYSLPIRMGSWLLLKLWGKLGHHGVLQTERKDNLQRSKRVLVEAIEQHKALFGNRVFRLFQHGGVAFNLGALICLGALLAFTDRAFGWQSSLTDSATTIHRIVSTLALPWSWYFGEGVGYPDLQQVAGSRIVLRESSFELQSYDLLSWWPFLALSVVVYGLLPRVIAWLISIALESRLLSTLEFSGYHYQALWRRLHSIELQSYGKPSQHSPESAAPPKELHAPDAVPLEVFVLEEAQNRYSEVFLKQWLQEVSGFVGGITSISKVADCAAATQGEHDVFLVIEGWQPPIEEKLAALSECAQLLQQKKQRLHLLLLGKPTAGGSVPMTDRLTEVWRKKLDQTEQANLYVHSDSAPKENTGT